MDEQAWTDYLRSLLEMAAGRLSAVTSGPVSYGIGMRTIGGPVAVSGEPRWLRVVCETARWAGTPAWNGNAAANSIEDVPKPRVLRVIEWQDGELSVRAELQTIAPSPALSETVMPPGPLRLDDTWWTDLRRALDALAATTTDRVCIDSELLRHRVLAYFGAEVAPGDLRWTTAHGDLQWSNLTGPVCWLLDWEAWGTAPAGYDAASLYCASLAEPSLARRIRAAFADQLDTPTGRVAQLAAAAKLLGMVEHGEHPELAAPLHAHADALLVEQVSEGPLGALQE